MKMQPRANELRFMTKNDGCVHIHPSSVNYAVRMLNQNENVCEYGRVDQGDQTLGLLLIFQVRHYDSPYLVYHEKVKTSRVFIRDCSMVSVYTLVLFGGGQVNLELYKGEFIISLDDGWIRFAAASHQVTDLNSISLLKIFFRVHLRSKFKQTF